MKKNRKGSLIGKCRGCIVAAVMLLVAAGAVSAQEQQDGDKVKRNAYMLYRIHFRINSAKVDPDFMGNEAELYRLSGDLDSLFSKSSVTVDSVMISSSSSIDGAYGLNRRLAVKRGTSLQRFLMNMCDGLQSGMFVQFPVGEDWGDFRNMVVSDTSLPEREKVLEIVDSDMTPDMKEKKIRSMKETFGYILENHLSEMRFADITLYLTSLEARTTIEDVEGIVASLPSAVVSEDMKWRNFAEATGMRRCKVPMFNVKTNMLYDIVAFPSLEVEIPIGKRWSFNMEGSVAWWSSDKSHTFYQLDMLSPEVRWWFGQKSRWHGHYIGAFGMLGLYDLEWKGSRGYQGEYWGVGISYGYMFPITKHLSIETGIGVGYMRTGYEEYLPMDGHYVYQQTGLTQFVGPLKLKVGLVWRIGDRTPFRKKGGR